MGERKVLNKYYPPDFDPAKIPKRKQLKNLQMKVRMMLPMSIRCNTCGTYMYMGTKFNCRKEDVVGDTYLGLLKFRFYFKCVKCSAELVMKTDPKNCDYEMEFGASRNFEPWRDKESDKEAAIKAREAEEMGDAMKALENRTMDSKMEMDILAGLDEVKSLRARQANIDQNELLEALRRGSSAQGDGSGTGSGSGSGSALQQKTEEELEEEDEKLIKSIVFRNSQAFVKRIEDDDEEEEGEEEKEEEGGEGNSSDDDGGAKLRVKGKGKGVLLQEEEGGRPAGGETLSRDAGKSKLLSSTGDGDPKGKRQKLEDAEELGGAVKGEAATTGTRAGRGLEGGPKETPSGVLVIKKLDDEKPIFEMKPLKVAFAVKEKKKAGVSSGGAAPRTVGGRPESSSRLGPVELGAGASERSSAPEEKPKQAPEGLALLSSNYDDSGEESQ